MSPEGLIVVAIVVVGAIYALFQAFGRPVHEKNVEPEGLQAYKDAHRRTHQGGNYSL